MSEKTELPAKRGADHTIFLMLLMLALGLLVFYNVETGAVLSKGVTTTAHAKAQKVLAWVFICFPLQYFMGGRRIRIVDEIIRQHNQALAQYMAGIFIAVAILLW